MPKVIWSDTKDGNNHVLLWENARLHFTVEKPDGTTNSFAVQTKATADQWSMAFKSGWEQLTAITKYDRFLALRIRQEEVTGEVAYWHVDHTKHTNGAYGVRDTFLVGQPVD